MINGRKAFRQLIDDVQGGAADFAVILVYDVSRWGRFQDGDEGATYEFVCRKAGVEVRYCGRPSTTMAASAPTSRKASCVSILGIATRARSRPCAITFRPWD